MEDRWLAWAKRLQALASTGRYYSHDGYDQERYEEVAAIAQGMLAALADAPLSRIRGLVPEFAKGYVTPLVEVRGALLHGERILLVRERSDARWTLPGGFADVGKSPRENIEKEVWEEATLRVEATALYGIRHKAKHGYDPDVRDFYKLFFVCRARDREHPRPGLETTEVGFFTLDALPPLSTGRVLAEDLAAAFRFRDRPGTVPFFD